jgi:chlorophyllide a reductase subunit Z
MPWDDDALALLHSYVEVEPVLTRISASKQLRDRIELDAEAAGETRITRQRVVRSRLNVVGGRAA